MTKKNLCYLILAIIGISCSSNPYKKTEKVRVFNEWEQARIDKALKQYENGECISDEEAQKEIEKWFEEQE